MTSHLEIFFHCGMMRTGTTYLQNAVFPFFEGIHYIHKRRYHDRELIVRETNAPKYLISFELAMNQQWNRELISIARRWPHATPIVVLRKHSDFLLSEYKRQLKNGTVRLFNEIWDPDNPDALYQPADLMFSERLDFLDQQFTTEPVVMEYSALRNDALAFIQKLAAAMDVSYDPDKIDLTPRHTSYDEPALVALRSIQRYINLNRVYVGQPTPWFRVKRFLRDIVRYGILHATAVFPTTNQPLVPEATLTMIDTFYTTDWERCIKRIEQRNQRS